MAVTTIPLLPCLDVDSTVEFYTALGFTIGHRQERPYLYLTVTFGDVELHFKESAPGLDPTAELSGGTLVLVDAAAPFHSAFVAGLRERQGRVLATGLPRLTRLRPGQTRFTVYDPSGNSVVFIERDEPEIEYGGSRELSGLARALDNVRIFRDFKNDDVLAARALDAALDRHRADASRVDVARALADRAELAVAIGDSAEVYRRELVQLDLTAAERDCAATELEALAQIEEWMA